MSATRKRRLPPIHAQALNILTAYGANAHLYLPGVGAINGITAGNYLDSAGTTAASVDQPIGLMLDGVGVLGAELIASQDLSTWTSGGAFGNWNNTTSTATTITAMGVNGGRYVRVACTPGKTYTMTASITGGTSQGSCAIAFGTSGSVYLSESNSVSASSGLVTVTATAPATAAFVEFVLRVATSGQTTSFASVSGRGIPGIHASQAAPAAKPILRLNNGIYSAQFDGVDDFLQTTATTGNEGWFCAGVTQNAAANAGIAGNGASGASAGVAMLVRSTGALWGNKSNGTTEVTTTIASDGSVVAGVPFVYEFGWNASTNIGAFNGTEVTQAAAISASSATALRIGEKGNGAEFFNGPMTIGIYLPVMPSPSDRATLRKFVASLSGVTL